VLEEIIGALAARFHPLDQLASFVEGRRIVKLSREPTWVIRPLTMKFAPSLRPTSTSHSPVQSAIVLPLAASSASVLSRVITKTLGAKASTCGVHEVLPEKQKVERPMLRTRAQLTFAPLAGRSIGRTKRVNRGISIERSSRLNRSAPAQPLRRIPAM